MDDENSGSEHFQRRWWGRHQPLEPDPRNIVASTVTAVEETATGSSLRRLSLADLDPNGGRGCASTVRPACVCTCWPAFYSRFYRPGRLLLLCFCHQSKTVTVVFGVLVKYLVHACLHVFDNLAHRVAETCCEAFDALLWCAGC